MPVFRTVKRFLKTAGHPNSSDVSGGARFCCRLNPNDDTPVSILFLPNDIISVTMSSDRERITKLKSALIFSTGSGCPSTRPESVI